MDCDKGPGLAYGFVEYEDPRDAEDAMHYEHGRDVGGSRIVVEWTRSREVHIGVGLLHLLQGEDLVPDLALEIVEDHILDLDLEVLTVMTLGKRIVPEGTGDIPDRDLALVLIGIVEGKKVTEERDQEVREDLLRKILDLDLNPDQDLARNQSLDLDRLRRSDIQGRDLEAHLLARVQHHGNAAVEVCQRILDPIIKTSTCNNRTIWMTYEYTCSIPACR
ncbi:uncharacterized protein TRIADDRAFT_52131 [Trichoplax adhaerens]|uniref:RRM domain-containing protein n=1 Tax=Trichoplax adhaerens TaxID=10228 RepID=B3RLU9_TRIAD|nr:hypothetical protein TRIADDRAFT_52131 [Trichoplax adhaerens]EDV28849.1 hypothetical protein TRIADDRAFT_52131 [Trichoplax adhaerens]|eukprot:XP_002108051.1 hypothetical protein TRIADDRAFT_52131 [Trichoplax adhaerens]